MGDKQDEVASPHVELASPGTLFNEVNSDEESKGGLLPLEMSGLINA